MTETATDLDKKLPLHIRLKRVFYREPDFCIGGWENPYIRRWWVIPRNKYFNIYLHNMLRDDDDRALHDHPWWNISIILKGGYIEHMPRHQQLYPEGDHRLMKAIRLPLNVVFRRSTHSHRLELQKVREFVDDYRTRVRSIPSWSIFITGPKVREWGFWCGDKKKGWRWIHWRAFTDPTDTGKTGRGCDQLIPPGDVGTPENVDKLVQISMKQYQKNPCSYLGDTPDSSGKWFAIVQTGDGAYKKIDLEERI